MKCFYHSADLDGHCSGAIVKYCRRYCEMIGINYGQPFPWETILSDEFIIMVDYSLQPFSDMVRLKNAAGNLVWIDHHKTAIDDMVKSGIDFAGLKIDGIGACALVWKSFTSSELPLSVKLLAEYDVWNHSDPRTLPFQYGLRIERNTLPDNLALWKRLFEDESAVYDVINKGNVILDYEKSQNEKFVSAYAFETTIRAADSIIPTESPSPGLKAICCNKGFTNSQLFESVWDPKKYDVMVTFIRLKLPAAKWTVSLYSDKPEVDCGAIAKSYGGGGHKGAAGFQCSELPFRY